MTLSETDRSLVVKCLGMTRSAFEGEVLAAIRKANAIVLGAGCTWADLFPVAQTSADAFGVATAASSSASARKHEVRLGREHMVRAKMLLASGFPWDDWKADFLRSMAIRDAALTPGQQAKMQECEAMAASWRAAA